MKANFSRCIVGAAIGLCAMGSAHAEWTKTYVIDWYEPAMYFGAKNPDDILAPGTDCPAGTNPELDWVKVMIRAGYTEAEAKWLRSPQNPSRNPSFGQNQMAFRGRSRENVYLYPETYPDPGLVGVTGDLTEGFNLDDNEKTGYPSPQGQKGIDNNFYRTLGCSKFYRGPAGPKGPGLGFNDGMRNGPWSAVIVVHGAGKDPMNDSKVDVGFYISRDRLIKDGLGEVARDYTFSIKPSKLEGIMHATASNGVIKSKGATPVFRTRDPGFVTELELLRARLELKINPDCTLEGYVGGYRPWLPVYKSLVNINAPVIEALGWWELPSVYYALKRNADYSPTGPRGDKTHISYAMRVHAVHAYVSAPDGKTLMTSVTSYRDSAAPDDDDFLGMKLPYKVVDGMVPDKDVPFGKALEVYPVPANMQTASLNGGK